MCFGDYLLTLPAMQNLTCKLIKMKINMKTLAQWRDMFTDEQWNELYDYEKKSNEMLEMRDITELKRELVRRKRRKDEVSQSDEEDDVRF